MQRRTLIIGLAAAATVAPLVTRAQVGRPITDVVVLVPGIMGSVLARDGRTVWGLELSAFSDLLRQGNLDLAHLRTDVSGVQATSLFDSVSIIPGFWKIDGYTALREALVSRLQLRPGINYFEFAYDWRLDNRIAARRLAEQSREWLGAWRESTSNPLARLVFVAHSMGGLVVRHAAEVLGLRAEIRSVFSIGTPYRGSVKALATVANGLLTQGLTRTVASFDSVYQLMPTYDCLDVGGTMKDMASLRAQLAEMVDMRRYLEVGKGFHDECDSAAQAHAGPTNAQPLLTVTQANTHRTLASARLAGGRLQLLETVRGENFAGDGTVPGYRLSHPIVSSFQRLAHYGNQLHGALQNSEAVIEQVVGTLQGEPFGTRANEVVSLKCSEWVRPGGNAVIEIALARAPRLPQPVRVLDASTGQAVSESVVDGTTLQFRHEVVMLAAGVYRVTYGDPMICSDLFCVA